MLYECEPPCVCRVCERFISNRLVMSGLEASLAGREDTKLDNAFVTYCDRHLQMYDKYMGRNYFDSTLPERAWRFREAVEKDLRQQLLNTVVNPYVYGSA